MYGRLEEVEVAFGSSLGAAADSLSARKSRGAFFTPPEVAEVIAERLITASSSAVLEPACGEAVFMEAAYARLESLGCSRKEAENQVWGVELHRDSADAAMARLLNLGLRPQIQVCNFFDVEPSARYDVVIGNPPYIRYQSFSSHDRMKGAESALALGVRVDPLSSSWAPFVLHAARFLKRGGSLGFVLPREILVANYAAPIRAFLSSNFSSVNVQIFEKSVFPEVEEGVVILFAEGFQEEAQGHIRLHQYPDICALAHKDPSGAVFVRSGVGRWPSSCDAVEARRIAEEWQSREFVGLKSWGNVRLGAVTGANAFFAVDKDAVKTWHLPSSSLYKLCPPGSGHLRNLRFTDENWQSLRDAGGKTELFHPAQQDLSLAGVRDYLAEGEAAGISKRYKCRIRTPWWIVPGLKICDCFITYMNGWGPNLCVNEAGAYHLNSVHGLYVHPGIDDASVKLLSLAFLSSVSQLSAEIEGRSYGGGLLKLEPREAACVLVPSYDLLEGKEAQELFSAVELALSEGHRDRATALVDGWLVESLGLDSRLMAQTHELCKSLRSQRMNRAKK